MKVFLVASMIACILSLSHSSTFAAQEEDGIKKVITGEFKALSEFSKTRDKQSILKFYTKDYMRVQNGKLEMLEDIENWLSDIDKQLKHNKLVGIAAEVTNIDVHILGTTGWATYHYQLKRTGGEGFVDEESGLCTSIHTKVGELWLNHHDHCSSEGLNLRQLSTVN